MQRQLHLPCNDKRLCGSPSDESPFLPGGPPPPGTDPVFDRMVEAELANRVNTPRADGDPPADFFK